MNSEFLIDESKLAQESLPYLTGTYIAYLITSNMGLTAALVHMAIWNYNDIKEGWSFASPSNIKKMFTKDFWLFWKNEETPEQRLQRKINDPDLDPHYKLMLKNKYKECPQWWWLSVALASFAVGLGCLYVMKVSQQWDLDALVAFTDKHLVDTTMVGLHLGHDYHHGLHAVPGRTDGLDRIPVQHSANLSDACRIHVSRSTACQFLLHMLHLQLSPAGTAAWQGHEIGSSQCEARTEHAD